ncbi:DUF560 domain-containing protein [Aurantiacibacter xanthus]|uniref:DUF560 domain-containing protein n=1 Tax=Aurantiacibacter xanthus TaxID=1784712 RepID=A0A3A1PG47_9SPHN|nr:DUF560 domain-containing protein [Aurantiacibacter xanthus]
MGSAIFLLCGAAHAVAQDSSQAAAENAAAAPSVGSQQVRQLTPAQLFAFAGEASDAGDYTAAETAYRALATNPDIELRTEARFRLALMLADKQGRFEAAAVLLRNILDDKPDAARVRVELARMQATLGHFGDAQREIRAAQAAGLPQEVEQLVRFYAAALAARKRVGGSFQLALAPDSNINRATRSDTLETVIGNFDLDQDAQATSGVGLALRAQAYFRAPLSSRADLLIRSSGQARFYGKDQFNDYVGSLEAGPQFTWGSQRLSLAALVSHRWFGGKSYTTGYGLSAEWQKPVSRTTRLTLDAVAIETDDLLSDQRDARRYSLGLSMDKAVSARFGGGVRLSGFREVARDPGYSLASGGADVYLFREFGHTTLVLNAGYDRTEADARILLYPRRRMDGRFETGISGTFRALRVGVFAPLLSARYEKSNSTIELYDYSRVSVELGITAAF